MAALEQLLVTRRVNAESLAQAGFSELTATDGLTWAQLLKRPEVGIEAVLGALGETASQDPLLAEMAAALAVHASNAETEASYSDSERRVRRSSFRSEARSVETGIKFAGYLEQQRKSIDKLKAAESVTIPEWIDYSTISGLSREMRETLERVRPITIGQASRLPGVTPAALTLVHVSIRLQGARRAVIS